MDGFDSSDDLDDDWFYESVRRYNTLQMFYLQNVPQHVLQMDEVTLCLGNINEKHDKSELLELSIPKKLTMLPTEEGRSKDNDFKILFGVYTKHPIHQMGAIQKQKKIVTSQKNRIGLQIYNLESNNQDENSEQLLLPAVNCETPVFEINQYDESIICSNKNYDQFMILDLKTERVIREIKHPFYKELLNNSIGSSNEISRSHISFHLLDTNILSISTNIGDIALLDLRTEKTSIVQHRKQESDLDQCWILSDSDFDTQANYFGILSNRGKICIFDSRNTYQCIDNECFTDPVANSSNLKLKMANRGRFSISGKDSNVYVYNILQNNFELAFTHNGHTQKKSKEFVDVVNDHIWLPGIGNNFIVSICSNRSLNCWEYNEGCV